MKNYKYFAGKQKKPNVHFRHVFFKCLSFGDGKIRLSKNNLVEVYDSRFSTTFQEVCVASFQSLHDYLYTSGLHNDFSTTSNTYLLLQLNI